MRPRQVLPEVRSERGHDISRHWRPAAPCPAGASSGLSCERRRPSWLRPATGAIFLILEMYQPFSGIMRIDSEPLRQALAPLT